MLFDMDIADLFLDEYQRARGNSVANVPFWDLLTATRAMPDPAVWLPGYEDLGRGDIIEEDMRSQHTVFLENAFKKLGR
jgi:hypothetical protein